MVGLIRDESTRNVNVPYVLAWILAYIFTYLNSCVNAYILTYMYVHASMLTCKHPYMHTVLRAYLLVHCTPWNVYMLTA